jgi:anti-sigma factor RsiW
MTQSFDCGNADALVGYLYDECDPVERAAISAHLVMCSRCASEVAMLRATRAELAVWPAPEAHLGFRLVSEFTPSNVIRPARWWQRPLPAWAQAAAAVVIFVAGAGLGALRGGAFSSGTAASATTVAPVAVTAHELDALEQRLRSEIAGLRTVGSHEQAAQAVPASAPSDSGNALVLQQVRQLIRDSEMRQQRELALRTAEVIRDFDTQRRGDLTRIEQTFGRMEGTNSAQVEQQRQMLNYLMRVSQSPQP